MIDVVVAITVFQHIPNREARHWAAQLRRVLKDTGKVLIIEGTTGYGEHMFLRSAGVIGALLRRRVVVSASLIDHYIALLAR
jgi:cyclopropane fatty-acyl-phospholipid synthase-like methyltransferase